MGSQRVEYDWSDLAHRYLIILWCINGVFKEIPFLNCTLVIYWKTLKEIILILYPMTLLNPLIYSNSLYIFWIFSVYHKYLNIGECVLSHFSHAQLFVILGTVAHQSLQSVVFSKQEYWSSLLFPPPGDLPDPEIKTVFLMCPALASRFFTTSTTSFSNICRSIISNCQGMKAT